MREKPTKVQFCYQIQYYSVNSYFPLKLNEILRQPVACGTSMQIKRYTVNKRFKYQYSIDANSTFRKVRNKLRNF